MTASGFAMGLSNVSVPAGQLKSGGKRIAGIEWMRAFCLICIILGHLAVASEGVREFYSQVFHSSRNLFAASGEGVEFFFIVAGFFLFKTINRTNGQSVQGYIKRQYSKLFPSFFAVMLLCWGFGFLASGYKLLDVVLFLPGLSLPGEVSGWGDWYIGVYFWGTLFYFLLITRCRRTWPLWVLLLVYVCISVRFNLPREYGLSKNITLSLSGNYGGWLGVSVARGLGSLGIGVLAGWMSDQIRIRRTWVSFMLLTLLEAGCLYTAVVYLVRGLPTVNILEIQLIFALIIICFSLPKGGGVSCLFNRMTGILVLSKYLYVAFVAQIFVMRYLLKWPMEPVESIVFAFATVILFSLALYHLLECKAIPYLAKFFRENRTVKQ